MYDRSNEAQGIHCVSTVAENQLGQLTSMHNPSHSGYYDRCPPTHFRHWNEDGYTPPYHYAKQHNGHHVRPFHPHHHPSYHYDWRNHHAPLFHRPHYHSSPPSRIHKNWRPAQQQAVPKIIIQRSNVREEKGKVLHHSSDSKSPPLYHVKTNSPAVSGASPKDYGEINLPRERKLFSGRKEKKVKKDTTAVNEKLSEVNANKPEVNAVMSNSVSDKKISSNISEGVSQKDSNSNNPSDHQISSVDATVTHSENGGEIKAEYNKSDLCASNDSLNTVSNHLTERDNSKREDSREMKSDFNVEDNSGKMEFNVGKSYNMKNCKRNSLVKLKKRYPELQKLFGKDPLIKLRRLSAAKIARYEPANSHEFKGHTGPVSERKCLELNKENKSIRGIPVDPKVMSFSRALQKPPNGKRPVETIFKSTASRLKSTDPFPKSKRDAPKISYTDISKLKMKLKNIEVPRSPNISSKTSHSIKSMNPQPSSETNKKGSTCLDKSPASSNVYLNEHSQEYGITRFINNEFNHIAASTSVTNENETKMKTCSSEIARTETEKCNMLGNAITSSQNIMAGQIGSESMPPLTIRRDDQMQKCGQILTSGSVPSTSLLEPQVVSDCLSLAPVEGKSNLSKLGRQGDSLCDKRILKPVNEEIIQKKETVKCINSESDLSQDTFKSESFDDRHMVDVSDSKTIQRGQGEEFRSGYDQRQISTELHTSCGGDMTDDINQSGRDLMAHCSKHVTPEIHTDSTGCLPSDLDSSVIGESMNNYALAVDSTPHSDGEKVRSSEVNQAVGSCTNRGPVWQYNCSEEMLIAADTLLSVGSLPACGATKTVENVNYPTDESSFGQREYVTCPEETIGLDLTVNSFTTKDNTIVVSVNSIGENKCGDVKENSDNDIEGDNSLVKRKWLKVGKQNNKDKDEKSGEEEESQAGDSDATYIYTDSGEDSINQLIEEVHNRGKDGSLPTGNSKKLSKLEKDSESTKHSSNAQKAKYGQKKGGEKSNYAVKGRAKGYPSELVEDNNVSNGAEQKLKRKLCQDNDIVIKRRKASGFVNVVIGKIDSGTMNEGQVNKNADGHNGNDSGKIVSESNEIKSKKAKRNKKVPAEENVAVRKKKEKNMKKANVTKDMNILPVDNIDKKFPDIVQSSFPKEKTEEIKKSDAISTKTEVAKATCRVGRKGKRLLGRRGGITRGNDKGPPLSADEGKARRGKGCRGDIARGQKTFTRVVKRRGKDLQIHLNEVLHHGEDSDDLPTILPPKRRRRPQQTSSHHSSDKMDRIMAEFPKHNWLITKYQSEPEDLSLCNNKKKVKVQLEDKAAKDSDSTQPITVLKNPGTDQNELGSFHLPANQPVKDSKEDDKDTEEDSFDSPLYIDMDGVNEKEVDEDSPTSKQHPLDLCVKKNDKASVTFRQHSNPPVQLVHPHVHRPPTSGSFGQLSTVSSKLLRDTKHALSSVVVSSQSSEMTQGIVTNMSTDWSTSTVSAKTGTNGDLISEITDLGKSIQVPENLLKHDALPVPLCTDISDGQTLCNSCDDKEAVDDTKLESYESGTKFVQPAIPRLIPASSIVPGSNFSPAKHTQNHDIVLLPVSLGPLTDSVPDVDEGQNKTSNSQVIQVEKSVSMQNVATDISENRNLLTCQERTDKEDGNEEQLCQNTILCSSTVQMNNSSNETNIVYFDTDSIAITSITTSSYPSLLTNEHSASLSSNPSEKIVESTLVASHLSHGSIPTTSIGSTKSSNGPDIDIFDIKSNITNTNSEGIGNDIFLSTTIPEIPEKKAKLEMKQKPSVKCKTPSSECETIDAGTSTHIKSLMTDISFSGNHSVVGVMGNDSVNMADSTLDMTKGEPPMKKYCEYPASKEPPPLMMAHSASPDQNISYLANNTTMTICSPDPNAVVELDPEIEKQMEELEKKIQQNEKEKEEMLNAKKKMAELMERKKREKLEEQLNVIPKDEQQQKNIENVPVQTANRMQDPVNHLFLSDSNKANLKLRNSHQVQSWSKYQSPLNESSHREQDIVALQETTSEQQQELPQPHSGEKQTPNQSQSLYQPPMKQNHQQKQREQQKELTTNQLLVQTESFPGQSAPRSQNIHEQQQQNVLGQQQLSLRQSIPQHALHHGTPSLLQQALSPDQMSQTSPVFFQRSHFTEQASSQSLSSAENNLPWMKPQQPLSQQLSHTSLKQMMQIQNPQQQNIQGSNVPRQQLTQQQLLSCQQQNQLAGSELQHHHLVSQQRLHLQSPLHMQPSHAAQTQSPAHLQHGFQNQHHPSLTQQQQFSQTQQQNYYNHQAQLQPQQQQFQQNSVKSQTRSLTIAHSSIQTVTSMQRPNMQQKHQMQHYQQIRMQQQQQQQQPRPHPFKARPSNFGNTFQMPSSQQQEVQTVVKQSSSHELQCNFNPLRPNNASPSSANGTAHVTPTVPRQITLAMKEAHIRKQFGLPELQPAHSNNEKSLMRRDSEPPPPAHINCVSLKKLIRKMDRSAIQLSSAIKASSPYFQRNEPVTCPPSDGKISGSIEMKAPTKAHSQPPFNIAGKLIVQQQPGKTPSVNRPCNEDKEIARHSSIPNTPTSSTLSVQLPPRASSASDRQPTFTFHANIPSSATLTRSASSSQSFPSLSKQEESMLTDKGNTVSVGSLNSQQKSEGSVKFTNTSQAPPAIQSQDAVATPNIIPQSNIIDLTKECSTVPNLNDVQKDDTEKAVQLELNKAIAKRCKPDLLNTTVTEGDDWTQLDQQPSKASQQIHGMKLPLGPSSTIVLTVDNQPHAQQASLHVSPVLVSTPMNGGIRNQQQQWQKQLPNGQGPGLMMRPSPGMQFNTVPNMLTMQTPGSRLPSGQGVRMPPNVQNPMIRMIGSAAVPVNGVRMLPTAGNMQINRPSHPQGVMMQQPYRMNQQHLQTQRGYQNPEIMKHRTRQYIGAPRAGIMPPQQMPLHSSEEINQDSNSCVQTVQHPPLNPSIQANAFNQNRQQAKQITPSPQAFVSMSYQQQQTSSQARFAPMATYKTAYGHDQQAHTQNSVITGNEQLPNRPGKMNNTAHQTSPVTSTSQAAPIVPTSSTKINIPPQIISSVVTSEHPVTSQISNDMFPIEVDPTSKKTEAHLQQINGSCVMCGNVSLYLCSCCKKMWYCSPQCQLKHWTTHSQECRESTAT